jgi:hypothetical protein
VEQQQTQEGDWVTVTLTLPPLSITWLVVEAAANQLRDERAAAPAARPLIELGNELVVDGDVQSHVPRIAHWNPSAASMR